jgi:hypothetical protein
MSGQPPIPMLPDQPEPDFTYPTDHIVAIVETPRQLAAVFLDLRWRGFHTSDIGVLDSRDAVAFQASTGRSGVVAWLIRLAERLGIRDEEAEVKARYEQALRDGHYSVKVRASDPQRVTEALRVLDAHGARFVNRFTRFTIQQLMA